MITYKKEINGKRKIMAYDNGFDGDCPKCGSAKILEIIIDGHPTVDEMGKEQSKIGLHHVCSQCSYSPILNLNSDTEER